MVRRLFRHSRGENIDSGDYRQSFSHKMGKKSGKKIFMLVRKIKRKLIFVMIFSILLILYTICAQEHQRQKEEKERAVFYETTNGRESISWVDFTVSEEALEKAYQYDLESHYTDNPVDWITLLALTAAQTGGNFDSKALKRMDENAQKVLQKETTFEELGARLKYFDYYLEAYDAVLHGYVGEYELEVVDENGEAHRQQQYGLKAFSPIAKGFDYQDYDDFGASRSYGYARPHLGHDMMGLIGTPIVAVESGIVEALGWNQYGGWRIGIRSFDKKRYYYYAHLRQNFPYCKTLEIGSVVTGGDVIGYMGHTGYSVKENVNNIKTVHLHFGVELIFDEERRKEGKEVWIDCYELTKFLARNRVEVMRDSNTKEWFRRYGMVDPEAKKALQKE